MRCIESDRMSAMFPLVLLAAVMSCTVGVYAAEDKALPETLLLKDYRPRPIYNIPHTEIGKARHPVIDMHAHAYARTPAQIAEWARTMDAVGMEKAIILTGSTGRQFDEIYEQFSRYPGRFEVWCGFDYTGYDKAGFGAAAVKELERCYRLGARGVGELGDKGQGLFYSKPTKALGMHLDDARMDGLLEKCAELKMPVNIHVADPAWMYEPMDAKNDGLMNAHKWRLDNKPGIVGHGGMLKILERAVKRHPRTTFVACHFANCSHDLNLLGRLFDEYPNLYADISARFAETAPIPRFVSGFYRRYQDRLLYGTDMGRSGGMYRLTFRILESADEHFYAWDRFSYHWPLHGLALDDKILKKVYRGNALRVLMPKEGRPKPATD